MHEFAVGFGLGFLVALQLGPMSLFLVVPCPVDVWRRDRRLRRNLPRMQGVRRVFFAAAALVTR